MILEAPPKKLLLGISGFGETERRSSGIEDILWQASEIDEVITARFMWGDSLVTMAKIVARMKKRWGVELEINIVGYSYGGTTAAMLVGRLYPWLINDLYLIDPVWRPFKNFPSFLSLYGMGTVWVESNVSHLHVWRQKKTVIRGCAVERRSDHTTLFEDTLNFRHTQIDNSVQIKGAIIERLRGSHDT